MKSIGFLSACVLALSACGAQNNGTSKETASSAPQASISEVSAPASSVMSVTEMPKSCQKLLANIEKCVIKYEKENATEGLTLRTELEHLRGQISSGTDSKALEQACAESNRQSEQMPEIQC